MTERLLRLALHERRAIDLAEPTRAVEVFMNHADRFGRRTIMSEPTDHDGDHSGRHDETPARVAREWVIRLASGGMTAEDMRRFKQWLVESPAHEAAFHRERTFWQQLEQLKDASAERAGEAHQATSNPNARPRRARLTIFAGGVAAACIALIVWQQDIRLFGSADHRTAVGEQRVVTLPDGGIARLNTDSAMNVTYREHERRIELLRGEALFEVMPDREKPFRVLAHGGVTQAVGTAFVVRAQEQQTWVTVTEGIVDVFALDPDGRPSRQSVAVHKDQQTSYRPGEAPQAVEAAQSESATAWVGGTILIEGLPFDQAMTELDRYRSGRIVVLADVSRTKPVSGRFTLPGIDEAITALAHTQGLTVIRVTRYLVVIL